MTDTEIITDLLDTAQRFLEQAKGFAYGHERLIVHLDGATNQIYLAKLEIENGKTPVSSDRG